MRIRINTIRTKLILAIIESVALTTACMIFLCGLMIAAAASRSFRVFFFKYLFFFAFSFIIICFVLVFVFFLLLIRKEMAYIDEITKTLNNISEGDLAIHIPVRTSDELGNMAETVNNMAVKLRVTIEEERRLEKTKNDLITNMSHDLRTPLTSILGYLELIEKMEHFDEEKLRLYSNIAYQKCKDLKILIDDLFEYSKLSNAGITVNKTRINLSELMKQVLLGFIPELVEAEMEYRVLSTNEKLDINADAVLLSRVFMNLINNAVKYGKEGKYLDIELARENSEAIVRMISYGNTIPDADLPYIFEKFYRADKARLMPHGGSGLGLAIVKSIMEIHNGIIHAYNNGEKTVFETRFKIYGGG